MTPGILIGPLLFVPYFVAGQFWAVGRPPGWRDYGFNILISLSTAYLALPARIAAGIWSTELRGMLPWAPIAFSFDDFAAVPAACP